jgi:predicted phage tail protein
VSSGYLRCVRLRGELGERFGREHWIAVETPGEAVRAIEARRPGFFDYLRSVNGLVDFAVIAGGESLGETDGDHPLGRRDLEFVPVVRGAGDNTNTLTLVIGAVLLVAAVVLTWGAATPAIAGFLGVAEATVGSALFSIGAIGFAMVASGVAGLIAGTPKTGDLDVARSQDAEKLASYQFSGPVNTAGQGLPVPIVYGELIVGSHVVSMGIYSA